MCNTLRRGFYARFFAWIYDPFMARFERDFLGSRRRQLLRGLPFLEGIYILAEANEPA